jgi:pimeloyl-ACP methyl ester carboxylesterase
MTPLHSFPTSVEPNDPTVDSRTSIHDEQRSKSRRPGDATVASSRLPDTVVEPLDVVQAMQERLVKGSFGRFRQWTLVRCALLLALASVAEQLLALTIAMSTRQLNGHSYCVQRYSSSQLSPPRHLPLVIVPGFAQSISTYESHLPTFANERDVLIFQPRGLGQGVSLGPDAEGEQACPLRDDHLFSNVSLPAQAARLLNTIDLVFPGVDQVDVAAFSLGGRIALCAALLYPHRMRCLHLTGVSLAPSSFARTSFYAWKFMLRNENLEGVAWNSLLASYHPTFLATQESRLYRWVEQICQRHTSEGLLALLEQAYTDDWSVASMTQKAADEGRIRLPQIRLCVGQDDRMSPVESVLELAEALGLSSESGCRSVSIVENCGHAVPLEASRIWRQSIVEFTGSS